MLGKPETEAIMKGVARAFGPRFKKSASDMVDLLSLIEDLQDRVSKLESRLAELEKPANA